MTNISRYEYYSKLPDYPFAVYFLNDKGQVSPKKMFTATRKRINEDRAVVEIYIYELSRFIEYSPKWLTVVHNFILN